MVAKRTEKDFQDFYSKWSKNHGLNPNPDAKEHHYNHRAAYMAGEEPKGKETHWPSKYKDKSHPNRFVDGVDTITGKKHPIKRRLGKD